MSLTALSLEPLSEHVHKGVPDAFSPVIRVHAVPHRLMVLARGNNATVNATEPHRVIDDFELALAENEYFRRPVAIAS